MMTALYAALARIRAAWAALFPPRLDELDTGPKPDLVYYQDGVGYTEAPDYLEVWSEDKGQHDLIKMDMRLAIWRYQNGKIAAGPVDAHAAGAAYRPETRIVGPLFPVTPDLAEGSRRLGYSRLVAATGLSVSADTEASFWSENEEAVRAFAAANYAANSKTAQNWPAHMGKFAHDTEAQIVTMYSLGEPDGPTLPAGKEAAPMRVFAFTRTTSPTFSPATATQSAPSGPARRT